MLHKKVYGEEFREKHYFEKEPYVRRILLSRSRNRLTERGSDEDFYPRSGRRSRRLGNRVRYEDADEGEGCAACVFRNLCFM